MINLIMKKLSAAFASVAGYLTFASSTLALQVKTPQNMGIDPTTAPSTILQSALTIVYIVAALLVLYFLIMGAFKWITSGGDKDAIGKARGAIINALIGLAILALAVVIVIVVGKILNINILGNFTIPNLMGTATDI
jgi:hypothetical protein